jgi:hypothetical protein
MSAAGPETRPAASERRRIFALVFGVSFDLGFTRAKPDEGPAMYWYGWIATSALGALVLGLVAALLPQNVGRKIPSALAWIVPVVLLPVLIYSLKFYWRW